LTAYKAEGSQDPAKILKIAVIQNTPRRVAKPETATLLLDPGRKIQRFKTLIN
jgi:hypothetical protein